MVIGKQIIIAFFIIIIILGHHCSDKDRNHWGIRQLYEEQQDFWFEVIQNKIKLHLLDVY